MNLTGYESLIGNGKPSLIDISNSAVLYEGYRSGSVYIICKINISVSVITRTWALADSWDNRQSLSYS